MATKKTDKKTSSKKKPAKAAGKKTTAKGASAKKAAPKEKAPKAEAKPVGPRHPRARVAAAHGDKASLAKSLAESLARADEDTGVIAERLRTASNTQLLRLQHVVETVKAKYGDRAKLIAKLGDVEHKSKDKDYLAKLDTLSLPNLLDLAQSHERRAANT
jgi:indole-3-glycerol phosphate synthase